MAKYTLRRNECAVLILSFDAASGICELCASLRSSPQIKMGWLEQDVFISLDALVLLSLLVGSELGITVNNFSVKLFPKCKFHHCLGHDGIYFAPERGRGEKGEGERRERGERFQILNSFFAKFTIWRACD